MKTCTNLKIVLRTLLLFLVCLFANGIIAQNSNDSSSDTDESDSFKTISPANTWTDFTYNPWMGGNLHSRQFRFFEDSVAVNNNWYFQLQWSKSIDGKNWSNLDLYREENGEIFVLSYGVEYMLMDFNVEAGETFSIEQPPGGWILDFLVVSVDSIELMDGSLRKRVGLGCYEYKEVSYYWVEGIGSLNQNLDLYHCALDVPHNPILCFYQNGELIYSDENYAECWITSVEDLQAAGITLYPNPALDHLNIHIENPSSQAVHFRIIHSNGAIINSFKHPGSQSDYRIQINDLQAGIYHLSWDLDGRPFSYRFVVAK